MRLIWATCGKTWGFRFLLDGGFEDPLPVYDRYFSALGDESPAWRAFDDGTVALRFFDPDGRRDDAGRVIPHEFVVFDDRGIHDELWIDSAQTGFAKVWPEVKDKFEEIWDRPDPAG